MKNDSNSNKSTVLSKSPYSITNQSFHLKIEIAVEDNLLISIYLHKIKLIDLRIDLEIK